MIANAVAEHQFHTPSVVTKNLKLNEVQGRKRVRISSNFLPLLGFNADDRIVAVPSYDGGFNVQKADDGPYKVHTRRYKRARSNNPLESVIEFASADLIKTFPPATERFHVEMRQGGLLKVRPVPNRVFNIVRRHKKAANPLSAMVAFTGGVDAYCLSELGFSPEVILEWRPPEARDKTRDLTEVNALNTLRNGRPRALVNENVYDVDPAMLKRICDEGDGTVCALYSVVCDDFSPLKSGRDKAAAVESLDTTIDQIWPVLRQVEECEWPIVVIENVAPFQNSQAGQIFQTVLRRLGYHLTPMTLNALDYGGIQKRKRFYLVASLFPGFEPPAAQPQNTASIWPLVERHLSDCRDVTHANFVRNRETSNRKVPMITKDSTNCSTIIKSQSRGVKDCLLVAHEGRVLMPSEGLLKDLMSIPQSFDVSWCGSETAVEILGQSIDYALHRQVMESVKVHIERNLGRGSKIQCRQQAQLF